MNIIKNKTIFLTGGTGSFGKAFTKKILSMHPKKLIIFSRDESKQWDMKNEYDNKNNLEFVIGDIRDKQRLQNIIHKDIDYVVHAAATKIVPTAETNPEECVKTNIIGSSNLIQVCIENKIKKVVGLSTDKACNPINLYGATKLAADKLFISANNFENTNSSKLCVVRYGNVIGSRGSVIPFFKKTFKEKGYIPITDKKMTRFIISLNDAVAFVMFTLKNMQGGEIFIKKIPSMNIMDIARSITNKPKIKYIGIRAGEKLHEEMVSAADYNNTYEYKDHFKILPSIENSKIIKKMKQKGNKVDIGFSYVSNKNNKWTSSKFLKNWLIKNPNYY